MTKDELHELAKYASPRPWTYRNVSRGDYIEDVNGSIVVENVGYIDGPLVVAAVNEAATLLDEVERLREALEEARSSLIQLHRRIGDTPEGNTMIGNIYELLNGHSALEPSK